MAVSGWLSSWATPAAISPMVAMRETFNSRPCSATGPSRAASSSGGGGGPGGLAKGTSSMIISAVAVMSVFPQPCAVRDRLSISIFRGCLRSLVVSRRRNASYQCLWCEARRIEDQIGFMRRRRRELCLLPIQHIDVGFGGIPAAPAALGDALLEECARRLTVDDAKIDAEPRGESAKAQAILGTREGRIDDRGVAACEGIRGAVRQALVDRDRRFARVQTSRQR